MIACAYISLVMFMIEEFILFIKVVDKGESAEDIGKCATRLFFIVLAVIGIVGISTM